MKIKIDQHGVEWFFAGVDEEDLVCPECDCELDITEDCEHPKVYKDNASIKCQCSDCGCIFTITRTLKEIEEANSDEDCD